MIELYAITDCAGPPLPEVCSLRAIATRELTAVGAPVADEAPTPEMLWRHEQVVEALMNGRDVLPVRYGTRVADEAAAREALEANYSRLAARLEFVRGAAEVSVRVLSEGGEAAPVSDAQAGSGSEYLRGRARQVAAQQRAASVVHDPLAAIARAVALRSPRLTREILRAAYLVDRDRLDRFVARVAELQEANPGLRLLCTGPWPPYSFAEP